MIREVKREELGELLDLLKAAFPETDPRWFPPYWDGDPFYKTAYTRVWEEEGKLVSSVQIVKKIVRVGPCQVLLGGIANVGTHPDYRKRGYATALLKDAIRLMREEGFHFSMLFTGIQPFYERLGWREFPFTYVRASSPSPVSPPFPNVRRSKEEDLEQILALYNHFNEGRNFTVVRDEAYMRGWGWPRFGSEVLVYEENGIIGYMRVALGEKVLSVNEFACWKGREEVFTILLNEIARLCQEKGINECTFYLPWEDFILEGIKKLSQGIEIRDGKGAMLRLINLPAFLSAISPLLAERGKDVSFVLPLKVEEEEATLEVKRGEVNVVPGIPVGSSPITLSQIEFFRLLFDFTGSRGDLPPELAQLFPPPSPKPTYYHFDSF